MKTKDKIKFAFLGIVMFVLILFWTSCSNGQGGEQGGSKINVPEIELDYSEYYSAAEFLAESIVFSMPKENFESGEVNAAVANEFILTVAVASLEDTRSPYTELISGEDNKGSRFPKKVCEAAIYEIFGLENYSFELGYGAEYDEETDEYVLVRGFGRSYYAMPSEIWAEASGAGGIAVNFTASKIENINGDPVWVPFGDYKMQFDIVTENGKTFLRYAGLDGFRYPGSDGCGLLSIYYPENQYDMSVEAFVQRENDEYIDYIYNIAKATSWSAATGIPNDEYKGFKLGEKFNSKILFNVFCYAVSDIYDKAYVSMDKTKATVPVEDVNTVLGKYFDGFEFDVNETGVNITISEDKSSFEVPGGSLLHIVAPDWAGYRIDSVEDNKNGTVTAVIIANGYDESNYSFVPNGIDGASHSITFEPKENSCKIISYEIKQPKEYVVTEKVDYENFTLGIGPDTLKEVLIDETLKINAGNFIGVNGSGEEFVILEYIGKEVVENAEDPFAPYDEKYPDEFGAAKWGFGGFDTREYGVRKDFGRDIYFCINLGEEIVTFKYVPRAGSGGTRTDEVRELLNTVEIKK